MPAMSTLQVNSLLAACNSEQPAHPVVQFLLCLFRVDQIASDQLRFYFWKALADCLLLCLLERINLANFFGVAQVL